MLVIFFNTTKYYSSTVSNTYKPVSRIRRGRIAAGRLFLPSDDKSVQHFKNRIYLIDRLNGQRDTCRKVQPLACPN